MEVDNIEIGVRSWLQPRDLSSPLRPAGLPPSDTCTWFQKSEDIKTWRSSEETQLLWITSNPGCGKTTNAFFLCAALEDEITKAAANLNVRKDQDRDVPVLLQFYCREGALDTSTPQAVLRSFLLQLVDAPAYRQDVIRIINAERVSAQPTFLDSTEKLWSLFARIVEIIPRLYIVLDGIDECIDNDGRFLLVNSLSQLFKASEKPWKILVTGRFKAPKSGSWSQTEISPQDIKADLENFVDQRLGQLENVQMLQPKSIVQIKTKLITNANSMFLWAKLSIDEIQQVPSWNIEETLDALPSSLASLYGGIFARLRRDLHPKLYQQITNVCICILAAADTVTFQDVLTLLALLEGAKDEKEVDEIIQIRGAILKEKFSSLIVINSNMGIDFVHSSLRQYLQTTGTLFIPSPGDLDAASSDLSTLEVDAKIHRDLAILCVRYLLFSCFEGDLPVVATKDMERHYPFLKYSSTQLLWHIVESKSISSVLLSHLRQLLGSPNGWRWLHRLLSNYGVSIGQFQVLQARLNDLLSANGQSSPESYGNLLLTLQRERLESIRLQHGNSNPNTIAAMCDLALVLQEQGQPDESLKLYKEALSLLESQYGLENVESLGIMEHIAEIYRDKEQTSEAEVLFQKVIEGRTKLLGEDHPLTLRALTSLGFVYEEDNNGKLKEAEAAHEKAWRQHEKVYGSKHPETLKAQVNLGVCYYQERKLPEAELMLDNALVNLRQVMGEEHPETLRAVNTMARVYREQGRLDEAEKIALQSHASLVKVLGDSHPRTLSAVGRLAWIYQAQGRFAKALDLQNEAIEGLLKTLGPQHGLTLKSMDNKAVVLKELGRFDEAEAIYRDIIPKKKIAFGPEHPAVYISMQNLGLLLQANGRLAEAEALLEEAYGGFLRSHGADHAWTVDCAKFLAECKKSRAAAM